MQKMLRKLLESRIRQLTDREFREITDLTTTDIMVNRISYGMRTSLGEAVEIAERCWIVMQRVA